MIDRHLARSLCFVASISRVVPGEEMALALCRRALVSSAAGVPHLIRCSSSSSSGASGASGPLRGVRVLDFTRVLAGPFCSMMLADYGAHVIKVEKPGTGDDTRLWGPPFVNGESTYFLSVNRNKHSIVVDLKHPQSVEHVIAPLVRQCDVVLENFLPGTADSLGIGYSQLSAINPRIVRPPPSALAVARSLSLAAAHSLARRSTPRSRASDKRARTAIAPVTTSWCRPWAG